ncbi:hypothetical protein WJX81_006280 [Elliptochloris bilobata]|uniref:ABC transporter domain-containing protein n=1 Tax=Elliptochloris bilobata TaxID=381761 RepID=A0AAW1QNJ1_9CHLO
MRDDKAGGAESSHKGQSKSLHISFRDLCFSVPSATGSKQVLSHVSGQCLPGCVTAIMGASGAGKTTLLNALASRFARGTRRGEVLLNGVHFTEKDFRAFGVYVTQAEPLLATATVRETIETSALLRLPLSVSRAKKEQIVEEIICQLSLSKCQNTMVGEEGTGAGARGISGGERKRVTVGVGLVTRPRVLLLDEPTSGLDSETALAILELLQALAQQNRTIVTTIHQPNSQITRCFDDLLLIARGATVYMGEMRHAVSYFDGLGYACPMYTNPTDYFMGLMKDDVAAGSLAEAWMRSDAAVVAAYAPRPVTPISSRKVADDPSLHVAGDFYEADEAYQSAHSVLEVDSQYRTMELFGPSDPKTGVKSALDSHQAANGGGLDALAKQGAAKGSGGVKRSADRRVLELEDGEAEGPAGGWCCGRPQRRRLGPPAWYQIRVLAVRAVRFYVRNPELVLAKLFTYIFMGGFMGLMYLRLPLDSSTAAYNRAASLWVAMFAFTLMPSETACTVWNQERAVVGKELGAGTYRLVSYFTAKTLVSVPFETGVAIIFSVIIYNMIGFQATAAKFFLFMATLILVNLTSDMVGFICGVITKDVSIGLILISVVTYFCFAFSGFIVQPVPSYFVWLHKLSYYSLAYTVLVKNEFTGLQLHTGLDPSCSAEVTFIPPPPANSLSIAANLGLLVLIAVGIRLVAFVVLRATFTRWELPPRAKRGAARCVRCFSACFC